MEDHLTGGTASFNHDFFILYAGVMYSGVNDVCGVTLSLYPHRAS